MGLSLSLTDFFAMNFIFIVMQLGYIVIVASPFPLVVIIIL